ncbi:PREDICTED: voltage-dependent T-type calcium channel subunit alpha-1G isoform X21 [Cercocebus atys]|uniref:voltage-dependent T-type calcium channel subunit alpha-1G isoform X21 n=1 Tax=Cercocebus atys TaxID=9531 RepID=UPI0005F3742C|nr:PREDICTED: voltage-dependent T-type calcium channel subunit alpha-1G isoform X21 [Cercocebus atys]
MDEEEDGAGAEESGQPRSFMRLNDLSGAGARPGPGSAEKDPGSADSEAEGLPYPALAPVVFFYLSQDSRPRSWCLRTVCNPWFERISMLVILLNCVTLGMFRPCEDIACDSQRCRILQAFDDFIFAFFAVEMVVKMVALGIFGKKCYLGDTWNRLDFFIVIAGMLEYSLDLQNVSFSAVRTVRVLRPLRAINRVPSMRILVTLLLDTLPMLGNVLLLCFFVFFIFGIVGVQLWAGLLRNRCFLPENFSLPLSVDLERYYQTENEDESPFICSQPRENGMRSCRSVPTLRGEGGGGPPCGLDYEAYNSSSNTTCVNWNQYYTNCSAGEHNPFKGAINFDNIGYAWIAIFQVITLEGWVDIMYFVMDAHSFYNFIYFILLIIVGSFFMINLCLVVIATQFSETKQRESQLMREQRVRFLSNASTLASFSEPGSCYEELLKYLVYILRKAARRLAQVSRAAGVRAGLLSSPAPLGGQETQPSSSCSRSHRRLSVHHLVHHHHHHHHHYHLGNGTLRVPRASPEIQDRDANGSRRLMLPPPSTPALSGGPPGGAESVHSFYHADCHLEPVRCQAPPPRSPSEASGRTVGSGKVYPTVHTSPPPETLKEKALVEVAASSGPATLTSLNIPPGPYSSMHKLLETQSTGACQSSCKISSPCLKADSGASGPDSCPYCARAGAGEVELADREMPDSDSEAVYEFTQDAQHSDLRDPHSRRQRSLGPDAEPSSVLAFWRLICDTFRKIVDSKYFGRGIMIAILVNTLSMGIEYHEQGDANKSESEPDFFSPSLDGDGDRKKCLALVSLGEHPELRKSLLPPLIIHTAATPMSLPKSTSTGLGEALGPTSRRTSSSGSAEPGAAHEMKSPPSARSSPHSPWSAASSWTSRRSSRNSLGRAPSLKRRSPSGERRSLLSGEGQESQDEEESSEEERASPAGSDRRHRESLEREAKSSFDLPDTLQVPGLHRTASGRGSASEHQDCNGKSASGRLARALRPDDPPLDGDDADDEGNLSKGERVRAWIRARLPACCLERDSWSAYIFPPQSRFRLLCHRIITHKMFDHVVLVIIFLNCITIAMERPKIDPHSAERIFLTLSNYIFTAVFLAEMTVKVVALGWCFGEQAYLRSSWNVLDGLLVLISVIDILVSMVSDSGTKILGMLRVLRLLRTLRPLRVISRAQGLKLVVETLMSSLKPIGNIVVICCAFFIIFGILGVQLFKGKFFVCQGEDTRNITNKSDCAEASYRWVRHKYNFDNLGQALMSLFVLASKDGWVDIMYDGLDAVGVDQQPIMNHNPWMLLYFISFLLIVAFFVLNMFVGVVVENFHKCRQHQEEEEARRREEKRLRRLEKKRRNLMLDDVIASGSSASAASEAQCKPYYSDYSRFRLLVHHLCTSHYLDLFITGVIGLNVVTMAMEHYQQPQILDEALKICNYIFTVIFVLESVFKLVAFGFRRFFQDRWNQLDLAIVLLSIMGITLEEIEVNASLPINPTIIRIMRVLRIARVLKLLKMAVGMRALLDTVMQALPQVGNLGLLFMLLFFIFAALGVELFGDLECDETHPCEGLGRHATFRNFGMAFLTLFRVSTGDNWNGIMKDTLRDCDQESTCYNTVISPIYFVSFVLTAQFVLVNVVIAVLMKHLEESNKEAKEEAELEAELELEMKTLSPQPHSPLGSPFLWPGVEGPDSPDSPKPGALHPAAHARSASHFSLEHPSDRQLFDTISLLIQGSLEWELKLMDELAGPGGQPSAFPSAPSLGGSDPQIPLAEMEALSLTSEIVSEPSCSLALTDDSLPDDMHTLLLSAPESNVQPHPTELPGPDLLTVRKSGVSRTHSLPNDSYMCRRGSVAEGPLGHRGWGLPKAQSGSVLSVHSQPADTSYILQLPKDAPHLLQPYSTPTWGTIPKLPPPGRSPLAQRPLRRQAAIRTDSLDVQGLGSREDLLAEVSGPSLPLARAYSFWGQSSTQAQQHSRSHSNISKHMPPRAPCPGPQPNWDKGPPETRSSLELDTELSWISGDLLPPGGQEEPPSPRDLKKCYSVEAQSCQRRPTSWLDEQRRHSIAVSCLDSGSQPHLGTDPSNLGGQPLGGPGSRPKKKLSPPSISIDPPESQGPRPPPSPGVCLRRRAPSSDSKDPLASGPPDSMAASPSPKKDVLSLSGLSSDPADLDP